jgi:hypothetical protein
MEKSLERAFEAALEGIINSNGTNSEVSWLHGYRIIRSHIPGGKFPPMVEVLYQKAFRKFSPLMADAA